MIMASGVFSRVKSWLLLGILLGVGLTVPLQAQAEGGNNQTIMALIVLPNAMNMTATARTAQNTPQNTSSLTYDADTNISILQKSDGVTYQVWVAI